MKKVYNKLIRDRIPEIIESTGKSRGVRKLDLEEYCVELKKKLVEEANEVNYTVDKASLIKEIADVLEVIDALKVAYGISDNDVDGAKVKKALSNGKFEKGLFLVNISREKTTEFTSSEPTVHSFSTTRTDKQHHFRGAVFLFFIHFSFDFSHIYITSINRDGIMNNSIHNRISMYTAT